MAGKEAFPVICVVLSIAHQLNAIVPPFLPLRPMRRYGPAFPNEILGSAPPTFRPPPGLLIAGHSRPGARPLGPVHHGGRHFPLLPSSSPPTPSAWPNMGPQIQRAQEASHFEYEVVAPPMSIPKPPTLLRPTSRFPIRPAPAFSPAPTHPPGIPREIIQIIGQESYPLQSRTERPPISYTGPQTGGNPPFVTPSAADFQEGYRILSDIFLENAGADIRSNLIGGSEVSFNGGFSPRSTTSSPMKRNVTFRPELVQIVQAEEKPILIAAGSPEKNPNENLRAVQQQQPVYVKAPAAKDKPVQMQESESMYGPPQIQPASHVSFMFTDPNEAPAGAYNLYEDSPPPPFNLGGNSIIPPPTPSPPQGSNPNIPPPSRNQLPPQSQSAPQYNNNGPSPPPPLGGNVIRNELPPLPPRPPGNGQQPFVMVPVDAGSGPGRIRDGEPVPSSDEVQQALGVLARYASKQAQGMGMNITPQMILQQDGAPSSLNYGPPPPNVRYAPPQQSTSSPPSQQSSQSPTYLPPASTTVESVTYGAPVQIRGPSAPYTTTEANAITISASQPEESSPFPRYGPPRGVTGGWSSGGGGGSGAGGGDLIGAKVQALKSIQSAVAGSFKSITGLKAGILNAGLSAIGNFNKAKGDLANSLKIPIVSKQKPSSIYGAPSQPHPTYGPPQSPPSSQYGPPSTDSPISTLVNAVGDVVGGITGTIAQTGRAAVGIGLSKNEFVKNHFVIKGQAFTEAVSKKVANKNQYFQNVMKHIQSIFDASMQKNSGGSGGWSSSPPGGY